MASLEHYREDCSAGPTTSRGSQVIKAVGAPGLEKSIIVTLRGETEICDFLRWSVPQRCFLRGINVFPDGCTMLHRKKTLSR